MEELKAIITIFITYTFISIGINTLVLTFIPNMDMHVFWIVMYIYLKTKNAIQLMDYELPDDIDDDESNPIGFL